MNNKKDIKIDDKKWMKKKMNAKSFSMSPKKILEQGLNGMVGKLQNLTVNRDGTQNITIRLNTDFRETYDELKDMDINVVIKKYAKQRSLDASARAWVLIDQIAEKTGAKKYEVYRHAIKEIGGVSDIVCVQERAVDMLCRNWQEHGQGWMTEVNDSKLPGCKNVTLWYGSSVYNTKQMSTLIDSLIQDAEALGIPTMSEAEKERLLNQWGIKIQKKGEKNLES